ncbi:MAG TPA: hypothetical protein VNG35_02530 [Gemmatimonadales bacterium]|nr:hypothetical protein [Gemmatimonadales bacterium]
MNPLFSELDRAAVAEGRRRREAALDQVASGTPPGWRGWAEFAVQYVARHRERFTTDAVWSMLDYWDILAPIEPRAMGPVMRAAASYGWCESTGDWEQSSRPLNHRRPVTVYRSLLWEGRP